MEPWKDVASQQVQLISTRLTELLSRALLWLKTELGVDLGLNPELIPPWVILLSACAGLVLMVLIWASLCRAVCKKQPAIKAVEESVVEIKRSAKAGKEEPKKKKKKSEKKSQPNGRAAVEPQEESPSSVEAVPHHQPHHHHQPTPPEVQTEKTVEVKKSKKKAKQVIKEPVKPVTTESKEPEEGTWETKVSNKEKREQRKKDKGSSDGSSSPGGGDTRVSTTTEQPKAPPAVPAANQKKKKGGEAKSEKVETEVPKVSVKTAAPVPKAEVPNVPPQAVATKTVNWTTNREPASLWASELDASWTVIDSSSLGTFTGLGVPSAEPKSMSQLPWLNQPAVDDEWSGINGSSIDCNSDWNAPSEVWGNFEEPEPDPLPVEEPPVPEPDKNNLLIEAANDENDKEIEDVTGDGAAKGKKKKKKKKKAAEEGTTSEQGEEPDKEAPVALLKQSSPPQEVSASVQTPRPMATEVKVERNMKENVSQKPSVTQVPQKPADVELTAKSNPASTQQKKPEESQGPKPAKKKKARRET